MPDPARGRALPAHLPAGHQIRRVDLHSERDRELARRVLRRLRLVAGRVLELHPFRPGTAMGIAAPQLGIGYRIAIVRTPSGGQFIELTNPRVVEASAQVAEEYEGCLCFFEVRGIVRRPVGVTVSYDRLDGEPATVAFTGGLARGVQHEIDHLDGKLYTDEDRMPAGMAPIPVEQYRQRRPTP